MTTTEFKFVAVVALGIVYFISNLFLTIGYFTPNWILIDLSLDSFDEAWDQSRNPSFPRPWEMGSLCTSIGLVNPTQNCDANVFSWFEEDNIYGIRRLLRHAYIMMTTVVVVIYSNAIMLWMTFMFDLLQYSIYNSLLSISFGVLYPIAAVLTLVAAIYVKVSYKWETGYSTMLCITAGCLMLIFYCGLILYDKMYLKETAKPWSNMKKSKTRSKTKNGVEEAEHSPRESNGHAKLHFKQGFRAKLSHGIHSRNAKSTTVGKIDPFRNWGLRRI